MTSVLSRVSAALSQFIKPIASSGGSQPAPVVRSSPSATREKPDPEGFQRHQPEKEEQKEKEKEKQETPLASVIPLRATEAPTEDPAGKPKEASSHSFFQIFTLFQERRTHFIQWFGSKAYHSISASQRKVGKYRKGAMLDRKAE